MSNEKKNGCLGCIGDEILPSYVKPLQGSKIPMKQPGFNGK